MPIYTTDTFQGIVDRGSKFKDQRDRFELAWSSSACPEGYLETLAMFESDLDVLKASGREFPPEIKKAREAALSICS